MKTKRIIKDLIEKSDLSISDKLDAKILLDRALLSEENQSLRELIDVLEKLYNDLGDSNEFKDQDYLAPRYQKAVLKVLGDYKSRSRIKDHSINTEYFQPFNDYKPITLEDFMKSVGMKPDITEDGKVIYVLDDPEVLDKRIKVAEDDGMGYAPKGFMEAFDVCQETENYDIVLWV